MSSSTLPPWLVRFWQKLPFRHMLVLCLILYTVGKSQPFPLSNFPMYSGISTEADVYFATDQADQPLSMDRVFDYGSSNTKKHFKKELSTLLKAGADKTGGKPRDTEEATDDERRAAGKVMLDYLTARMRKAALPPGTTAIRLYSRTFSLAESDTLKNKPPFLLAENPVSAAPAR